MHQSSGGFHLVPEADFWSCLIFIDRKAGEIICSIRVFVCIYAFPSSPVTYETKVQNHLPLVTGNDYQSMALVCVCN